jgi:hypothetical protein
MIQSCLFTLACFSYRSQDFMPRYGNAPREPEHFIGQVQPHPESKSQTTTYCFIQLEVSKPIMEFKETMVKCIPEWLAGATMKAPQLGIRSDLDTIRVDCVILGASTRHTNRGRSEDS